MASRAAFGQWAVVWRPLLKNSVSQTFLFHRPPYTLDTSFTTPSLIKHTQGSKFKEFYLMEVLNS